MQSEIKRTTLPTWNQVEKQTEQEIAWLRTSVNLFFSKEQRYELNACNECLLRKIAVLIVTGEIRASEINRLPPLKSFWIEKENLKNNSSSPIQHGARWHSETIQKIENHFLAQTFKTVREPNLSWGRADLGVYKEGEKDLLVEVGTTSLVKLFRNLRGMRNFVYLIVPNDTHLIEFVRD